MKIGNANKYNYNDIAPAMEIENKEGRGWQ